jgi:L-fuculose-phosphate aldolase
MYLGFFRDRPDIRSVVHCHPPAVGAFAILEGTNWLARPLYPELAIEVGPVARVRYAEPLTQELAEAFAPLLRTYNAFLMENHGLVILSTEDLDRTLQLVEILELSAVSILQALAVGPIRELSREALLGLENTRRTRNLPLMGTPGANDSIVTLYERARTEG